MPESEAGWGPPPPCPLDHCTVVALWSEGVSQHLWRVGHGRQTAVTSPPLQPRRTSGLDCARVPMLHNTHTHTHARTHARTHASTQARTHARTHTHARQYPPIRSMYIYIISVSLFLLLCVSLCLCLCLSVCVCLCLSKPLSLSLSVSLSTCR